jgi:lysylphosphatidylglycerol synthetase-like protein (DUF2156 family)
MVMDSLLDVIGLYVFALMAFLLLGGIACTIVSRRNKEKVKMSGAFRAIGLIMLMAFAVLLVDYGRLVLFFLALALGALLGGFS